MSWDATGVVRLDVDGHTVEHVVCDQNYTHNCNPMIRAAGWPEWPYEVGAISSPDLADKLAGVIDVMAGERRRFEAMNPENGWGDYASLLLVLQRMRSIALEWPSAVWDVSG